MLPQTFYTKKLVSYGSFIVPGRKQVYLRFEPDNCAPPLEGTEPNPDAGTTGLGGCFGFLASRLPRA